MGAKFLHRYLNEFNFSMHVNLQKIKIGIGLGSVTISKQFRFMNYLTNFKLNSIMKTENKYKMFALKIYFRNCILLL